MNNIEELIKELHSYKCKDKKTLLAIRIEERLNKSLKTYYEELTKTLNSLYRYDDEHENLKLMKNLNEGN